jgi:hypothetical protein
MYAGRPDRTRIMTILDISDPENPKRVSDFWLPVQLGEGRQPGLGETFGVHEPVIHGDRAYIAYADGGFAIADISDIENPTLVTHQWIFPELTDGQTHTCVPFPERDLLVVSDEAMATFGLEGEKNIMMWDIADEADPKLLSTLPIPTPTDAEPYKSYFHKGERFGPHGTHDNHHGKAHITDKVYNAYMNAGLRVWDVSDPANPRETASFVPSDPTTHIDPRPYNRIAPSSGRNPQGLQPGRARRLSRVHLSQRIQRRNLDRQGEGTRPMNDRVLLKRAFDRSVDQ